MAVALVVLIALLVLASTLLVVHRLRQEREPVLGPPVTPIPPVRPEARPEPRPALRAEPPAHGTSPSQPPPGMPGAPPLGELIDGLREAMADGELSDDEIQRLMPGAEVVRQDDGATVVQHSHRAQRIEVDGRVYDSVDAIPDPAVRERIRRLLGG